MRGKARTPCPEDDQEGAAGEAPNSHYSRKTDQMNKRKHAQPSARPTAMARAAEQEVSIRRRLGRMEPTKKIILQNQRLPQALKFAAAGWPVFPVYEVIQGRCACGNPECTRPGKHPRTAHGFRDATTGSEVIRRWWRVYPHAHIGIATGADANLFVLDVDGPDGERSLQRLIAEHGPLPRTATVKTGRGRHFYFKLSGRQIECSSGKLGSGLDVRGEGGYVVAPFSRHASGAIYCPVRSSLINGKFKPAPAPQWLLDLLAKSVDAPPAQREQVSEKSLEQARTYAEAALQSELDRLRRAPQGQRNDTLNLSAFKMGQLVAHGLLGPDTTAAILQQAARQIGLESRETQATIRSGLQDGQAVPRRLPFSIQGEKSNDAPRRSEEAQDTLTRELATLGQTDADNAERFARRFGDRVKCTPGRDFLVYDGTRWVDDRLLQSARLAEETARLIADEARYLEQERDRTARARFAEQSCSKGALDRMCSLAKSRLMIEDARFDADPWVLNVLNGTIDLRTGDLKPHDPRDLLTKLGPVAFDPSAKCPTFIAFLRRALRDDKDLIRYVQKASGYNLTGSTIEQVFFLLHGPTKTGKSTLLNRIRDLLGDYGLHTPTETLLAKPQDNSINADIARLAGARMVTAIEANWNRQFNEALIKALTGGDKQTARHLYRNHFEFKPEFKLWLGVNDLPRARGTDGAFWERVRVLPFNAEIPPEERDLSLDEKLKAEWPGILAWAVRGCLLWQAEGLGTCEAVEQAGGHWKRASDHLRRFVHDEVIYDSSSMVQSSDLYGTYRSWCERYGEKPLVDRQRKPALEALGLTYERKRHASCWKGIKLRLT